MAQHRIVILPEVPSEVFTATASRYLVALGTLADQLRAIGAGNVDLIDPLPQPPATHEQPL